MPEKPSKLKPAIFGGVITGATIGIPFLGLLNCFCCAGVLLGGLLSVLFYTRDLTPGDTLTSGEAVQLGALSGVFGAVIGTVLIEIFLVLFGNLVGEQLHEMIYQLHDAGFLEDFPPELEGLLLMDVRPGFFQLIVQLFTWLFLGPLFGLLGGLLGYSFFKPADRPSGQPPSSIPA